jgi:hypothetical protein
VPGGFVSGLDTPWHDFPVVIPGHTTIRLLITIHRPRYCQGNSITPGDEDSSGSHRVHWKSLLHTHITEIDDQVAKDRRSV